MALGSPVDEIKSRLDIVELVGNYVKLQKTGINYRALCPFHSEKTPSFFVSPSRQRWHCFGACSEGGDIFKFVMKIEGLEFAETLRLLAQKAGVKLMPQDPRVASEKNKLYKVCDLACQFFEKQLQTSQAGQQIKAYLKGRGLTDESIRAWRLGYAPDSWRGLLDLLQARGFSSEDIVGAGLAIKKEESEVSRDTIPGKVKVSRDTIPGKAYDRFRKRIMFPVFDINGQVIGFGGRVIPSSELRAPSSSRAAEPKYINTPSTLLYDKSRTLYGLHQAKIALRQQDQAVIVEGYTDAIMAFQAGFNNVVATAGTALTPYHLAVLQRYTKNLNLAFDMDAAGDAATRRGIELAQRQGFNLKVLKIPGAKDPADLIAENPRMWQEALRDAKDLVEFYFEAAFQKFDQKTEFNAQEKASIANELLAVIARIPNKISQAHWVEKLAKTLQVGSELLFDELNRAKSASPIQEETLEQKIAATKKSRRELLEEAILLHLLKNPVKIQELSPGIVSLFSEPALQVAQVLQGKSQPATGQKIDILQLSEWSEPQLQLVERLAFQAEIPELDQEGGRDFFRDCCQELKTLAMREELAKTTEQIKEAENQGRADELSQLLEKFSRLTKELNH